MFGIFQELAKRRAARLNNENEMRIAMLNTQERVAYLEKTLRETVVAIGNLKERIDQSGNIMRGEDYDKVKKPIVMSNDDMMYGTQDDHREAFRPGRVFASPEPGDTLSDVAARVRASERHNDVYYKLEARIGDRPQFAAVNHKALVYEAVERFLEGNATALTITKSWVSTDANSRLFERFLKK